MIISISDSKTDLFPMLRLLDFPSEIVEDILLHSDPLVVAAFAQTCRLSRSLVYHAPDQHLWRALYLAQPFDDPRKCVSHSGHPRATAVDWRSDLQRIIRARTVVRNPRFYRPHERSTVLRTLLDLVCNVPPLHSTVSTAPTSQNLLWVSELLRDGSIIDGTSSAEPFLSDEEIQLRAQLHTYFGLTKGDFAKSRRVNSRAYVYNLRNCSAANDFGPFLTDGTKRVNWLHVQALHHVVSMHIADRSPFPMSLPFTQAMIPPEVDLDRERDWAGLSGLWRCSFCFCDHQDLLGNVDKMSSFLLLLFY